MRSVVLLSLVLLGLLVAGARASARRDPLNANEVQQLRDSAQEPEKRLGLYVKFIRDRAAALEQMHSDPRFTEGRSGQIHDLLEDIDTLVQEMDDNIDQYAARRNDIRKPLKQVIELDSDLQLKLRAIKQGGATPQQTSSLKDYVFALDNALDSVNASLDNARQVMQQQEADIQAAKQEKKKKK